MHLALLVPRAPLHVHHSDVLTLETCGCILFAVQTQCMIEMVSMCLFWAAKLATCVEQQASRALQRRSEDITEFPFGAHVSGTAPASRRLLIASRASVEPSLGLASSEQQANSMAFSTYRGMSNNFTPPLRSHFEPPEGLLKTCQTCPY